MFKKAKIITGIFPKLSENGIICAIQVLGKNASDIRIQGVRVMAAEDTRLQQILQSCVEHTTREPAICRESSSQYSILLHPRRAALFQISAYRRAPCHLSGSAFQLIASCVQVIQGSHQQTHM